MPYRPALTHPEWVRTQPLPPLLCGAVAASQRRKGQLGEREAAALLSEEFGVVCKRTLDQPREGGSDISLPPFAVEVKRRATLGLHRWVQQAEAAVSGDHRIPLVMARGDGQEWVVIVPWRIAAKWMREEF